MESWLQVALSGFAVVVPLTFTGWYLNYRFGRNQTRPVEPANGGVVVEGSKAEGSVFATGSSTRVSKTKAGADIVADGSRADPKE